MPDDHTAVTQPRRRDRAVDDDGWISTFLHRAPVGVLATQEAGQPFVNSNLFAFDEERRAIYVHTARTGRTRSNVEGDDRACFTVFEMGRLLPAEEAVNFSVEYAGVTAFGRAEVVADQEEARHALGLLMAKYAPHLQPGADYQPAADRDLERTSVFRFEISAWVGKKKEVAADFPGAYRYQPREALAQGARLSGP